MAGHRTPGVLGSSTGALDPARGTLARTPPSRPGTLEGFAGPRARGTDDETPLATTSWVNASLARTAASGAPDARLKVLVRLVPQSRAGRGFDRIEFETSATARAVLEPLLRIPQLSQPYEDGGRRGDRLLTWLSEHLADGSLELQWRRRSPIIVREKEEAAPAPARAPTPVWSAPAPKAPEYSTFPPELDAAGIARTLVAAARDGVPFCEECRKAAAQRDGAGA